MKYNLIVENIITDKNKRCHKAPLILCALVIFIIKITQINIYTTI